MAQMFPETPRECTDDSLEKEMFEALSRLPDTYYVFHSFSIVNVVNNVIFESETDFVVFHPQKGLMCIEAKAGQVKYEQGEWYYGSGTPMNHDGPFNQASQNKWKLKKYIEMQGLENLLRKCKLVHAVWFPSIGKNYFVGKQLPPEADQKLILTGDSMDNLEDEISAIFDIRLPNGISTSLDQRATQLLLNRVLAPKFNLISLTELKANQRRKVFKSMLKEQISLLNYLDEQNTAVISGMAGTGKTVMAMEKARRHADRGEKVLFLCYNSRLKDFLKSQYNHNYIDFYTIDGFACKLCNSYEADYMALEQRLLEYYANQDFPWRHIIIDEGQDFGKEKIDEIGIVKVLKDIVTESLEPEGTFYMFYDKNQMVQADKIPKYISEADCKLTLYRNCRNTENIAITSSRLLGSEKNPKLAPNPVLGDTPEFFVANTNDFLKVLYQAIDNIFEHCYTNLVILTCKTEESSQLARHVNDGVLTYKNKPIIFTTCRKFKGLEADAVIIIDIDKEILQNDETDIDRLLYVGASRARFWLSLVANVSYDDCADLLTRMNLRIPKKPEKALAAVYNAKLGKTNIDEIL